MGLMSVLNIGTKGLMTAQLGMDLAGQNISNADVDGYSRKRMNIVSDYRWDGEFGQVGFGAKVINIERMRNASIDEQVRRQNHELGFYLEIDHIFERIENIFTEPSDTGLQNFIDKFFDSWQNLANNPADLSARNMVKATAESLCEVFHNLNGELQNLLKTRNDEIVEKVKKVNAIAKDIYNLNQEIAAVETGVQNANDSRDRRDQQLKELAKLIDIEITENELGQITVTTAGYAIVTPAYIQELETYTNSFVLPDNTTSFNIGIRLATSKRNYMPISGQIKGLFESRDVIIPEYMKKLDEIAVTLATRVNAIHELGYTLDGFCGIAFFDPKVSGAADINISASIKSTIHNIAAALGGSTVSTTENLILTFGAPATSLANRNIARNSVIITAGTIPLTEGIDYNIDYVRGTIQLLHNGYNGVTLNVRYEYNTADFRGKGDNENAIRIAQLRHQLTMDPDVLQNPTSTFTEYYSSLVGKLGLKRNEAGANLKTRSFLIEQYETQQDSISGVSLDEEMANIIKFQHSFAAAARLITTASQMLEVLINM